MSQITEPKRKKPFNKNHKDPPLPILQNNQKFKGTFNDFSVIIENEKHIDQLMKMGCFGKANLSRTCPTINANNQIIRNRVYQRRKTWGENSKSKPKKVVVLSDSEDLSGDESTVYNLKPTFQLDHSGLSEKLHLSLEEAFFLNSSLGVLEINHNGKVLKEDEIWTIFQETDTFFLQNYIVYHYFRARNWVVKSGIKFGGDFLLYKQGPQFYHATYVVIIDVVDSNFKSLPNYKKRSMDMIFLMGLNRLCETAGKDLLIVQVIWPQNDVSTISHKDLNKLKITEICMKRWIASQERQGDPVPDSVK